MDAYKPRRLKITDPSLPNYTGMMGLVEFENGVSIDEVNWVEAARLGAIVSIVDADDETHQVNEAAEIVRSRDMATDDQRVVNFDQAHQVDGETKLALEHFSREQLEAIADKEGLAGVRELARKRGATGRSIVECIEAVLRAQSNEQAVRGAA